MRLLREPLLHFAVTGGLIFLLYSLIADTQKTPNDVIVISTARIDQLVAEYQSVWNQMPVESELDNLIEAYVREEVYYRGALELDLDRDDAVVRRRLRQKMEFLMDAGSYLQEPSVGELETYYADNEKAFRRLPRLAFEQIYFGTSTDPEGITQSLSILQTEPETDPGEMGEHTLLPAHLGVSPPAAIDGVFGPGFFEQLVKLPPGTWAGPVTSAYGTHLIRVLEYLPAQTPKLGDVRDAVVDDWRATKAMQIREQDYALRRARFVIEIQRRGTQSAEDL
ncbi:MAG: peptidyl-prolyl cis-trans isomerase [Gammaproteobacteria bacterium]|nr:peptidyl-prolyl cis-trans isomerase [Gammaproteobacteria bacterium]